MATSRLSTRRVDWRVQVGTNNKAAQGLVIFEASVSYIPDPLAADGPRTAIPEPVPAVLDAAGYACTPDPSNPARAGERGVALFTTDSLGEDGGDWTWTARPQLRSVNGIQMANAVPAFSFAVPTGAGTLDLATVQKVPASPGIGEAQAVALLSQYKSDVDSVVARANAGEFKGDRGLPGLNAVPASEAVAEYLSTPGTAPNIVLLNQLASPEVDTITLRSKRDRFADSKKIRITSFQKQERENNWNGGETILLDVDARAKSMITWRLPIKPGTAGREVLPVSETPADSNFQRTVWAGAHYFAQDQPDNENPSVVHGHWSVEVPDPDLALRTRFEVKFVDEADKAANGLPKMGVAAAQIFVGLADFNIRVQDAYGGKQSGMFRIGGAQKHEKLIEFNLSENGNLNQVAQRWRLGMNNADEGPSNLGNDFVVRHFQNNGVLIGTAVHITRSNGNVLFGGATTRNARVSAEWDDAGAFGFEAHPSKALTGGTAFRGNMKDLNDSLLEGRVDGSAVSAFKISTGGAMEWGPGGSGNRDTYLSRMLANRLGTSGEFEVQHNLRVGPNNTGGGAKGVIALANAVTPPTGNNNGGGIIYAQDGALKFRGRNGTVTTIAPA